MILTAADFIEQLPVAAIVSDIESHQIVYLNSIAKEYFHETKITAGLTSIELLKLHGEDLEWYLSVTPSLHIEKFQDIYADSNLPYPVILDCCAIQHEGKIFRLDMSTGLPLLLTPAHWPYNAYIFGSLSDTPETGVPDKLA